MPGEFAVDLGPYSLGAKSVASYSCQTGFLAFNLKNDSIGPSFAAVGFHALRFLGIAQKLDPRRLSSVALWNELLRL